MPDYDIVYVCIIFYFSNKNKISFSSYSAAANNECIYVQVNCDDKTIGEHAEVNFKKIF